MEKERNTRVVLPCLDEQEIIEFYETGASVEDLAYSYGYTKYQIKKILPKYLAQGYIYRPLA